MKINYKEFKKTGRVTFSSLKKQEIKVKFL